jgi:phage gp29-like protein
MTVEAASDAPEDVARAEAIRDWLKRDELSEEVFDILDALGKGFSLTEIVWDTSEGQWRPERLERRDPRWFRFDRRDLATPRMLTEAGKEVPLPGFKFIFARMAAKSGLPLRSGLARVAAWGWMFKAFAQRDWAIFTQTYGQPLRLGKYGPGASERDRDTLFAAVANIAGDCAAIIPESMSIDFVEARNVGPGSELYERRADWLDRQVSKAVLGQTATTDAIAGGHAVGREHRQVQEDIERADASALAAILNRDLIRPWVDLEWGPQRRYPRLVIARPPAEDLALLAEAIPKLVDVGMRVAEAEVRGKFGLSEPAPDARVLARAAPADPFAAPPGETPPPASPIKRVGDEFKRVAGPEAVSDALHAEGGSAGLPEAGSRQAPDAPAEWLAERLAAEADPLVAEMVGELEAMLAAAGSLGEFREMLLAAWPRLDAARLAAVIAQALLAGELGGRAAALDDAGG